MCKIGGSDAAKNGSEQVKTLAQCWDLCVAKNPSAVITMTLYNTVTASKTDYAPSVKVEKLDDAGICTGFYHGAKTAEACQLYHTALVKTAGGSDDANENSCYESKVATTAAPASVAWIAYKAEVDKTTSDAGSLAKLKDTWSTGVTSGLAAWVTKKDDYDKLDMELTQLTAEEVKAKALETTAKTAHDTENGKIAALKSTYDAAKLKSDASTTALGLSQKALDAAQTDYDTKLATWEDDKKQTARQTTTKALADAAKVANDLVQKALDAAETKLQGEDASLTAATAAKKKTWDGLAAPLTAAKSTASAAESALTAPLAALKDLRGKVTAEGLKVTAAWKAITDNRATLAANVLAVETAKKAHLKALVECRSAQYDAFKKKLGEAQAARASKLTIIKDLLAAQKTVALGADGGRCEKPMSNGDFKRRGKCATPDTHCCGAAQGTGPTGARMTIEVCQLKTAKTYNYQPPRAPMATTMPATVSWDFACIGGAQQLAGAAAALLASAYMMA